MLFHEEDYLTLSDQKKGSMPVRSLYYISIWKSRAITVASRPLLSYNILLDSLWIVSKEILMHSRGSRRTFRVLSSV